MALIICAGFRNPLRVTNFALVIIAIARRIKLAGDKMHHVDDGPRLPLGGDAVVDVANGKWLPGHRNLPPVACAQLSRWSERFFDVKQCGKDAVTEQRRDQILWVRASQRLVEEGERHELHADERTHNQKNNGRSEQKHTEA